MEWTTDIEALLQQVRENSIYLSTFHKNKYFNYLKIGNAFRIPTIIISSFASVASVGLTAYLPQTTISATTCVMTLIIGILNSIELFLKVTDHIEVELETSKAYYQLSINLHKLLSLSTKNRVGEPKIVLDQFYQEYSDLFAASSLLGTNYPDKLNLLPKKRGMFFKAKHGENPVSPLSRLFSSDSNTVSSSSSIQSNPDEENPLRTL